MSNKAALFKLLLNKAFYNKHHHKIASEMFPDELQELYDIVELCHEKTLKDVTLEDVYVLYKALNPAVTSAKLGLIEVFIRNIHKAEVLSPEIAEEVLRQALLEFKATNIAQIALELAHNKHQDWDKLEAFVKEDVLQEDTCYVTSDLTALTKDLESTYKWKFNLPELHEAIGPIGPEVFSVLAGPVNSGKSLMAINFVFGPGGFAEQGAKVLYIGNEESLKRTMMRGASCYTGMTKKEIISNLDKAQAQFDKIKDNCYLIDDVTMNFTKLNYITNKLKPDIVMLDMLDKVHVYGEFGRSDEKLGRIYEQARELAKKQQCAVFGVSQTSAESFGKLYYSFDKLAGSRVEKGANADIVLLLGQNHNGELVADTESHFRVINIAKSKLEGNGKKINCKIIPELSRLVP